MGFLEDLLRSSAALELGQGRSGGTGGTSPLPTSVQLLARHVPVNKDLSPSLLAFHGLAGCPTDAAALPTPRALPWGGALHYGGSHRLCRFLGEESTQRCLHSPACTQRHPPASTAPCLGLGKKVSMGGEVSPPSQGSAPPTKEGLRSCKHAQAYVGKEVEKALSGLDSKYKDTQNTQNGEENTQNTQNGEKSVRHSPFCTCLIKNTPIRGEWRKSL